MTKDQGPNPKEAPITNPNHGYSNRALVLGHSLVIGHSDLGHSGPLHRPLPPTRPARPARPGYSAQMPILCALAVASAVMRSDWSLKEKFLIKSGFTLAMPASTMARLMLVPST